MNIRKYIKLDYDDLILFSDKNSRKNYFGYYKCSDKIYLINNSYDVADVINLKNFKDFKYYGSISHIEVDVYNKLIFLWCEYNEGLVLYDFNGNIKYKILENITIMQIFLDRENMYMWSVYYIDDSYNKVRISLYEYGGKQIAFCDMDEPVNIEDTSDIRIRKMEEKNCVIIGFNGHQDGYCDNIFKLDVSLTIKEKLQDKCCLWTINSRKEVLTYEMYCNQVFLCSYPKFEKKEIVMDFEEKENFFIKNIVKIDDRRFIIHDGVEETLYIYDIVSKKIVDEIIIDDYQSDNIAIDIIEYRDKTLYFEICDYTNNKEKRFYLVCIDEIF